MEENKDINGTDETNETVNETINDTNDTNEESAAENIEQAKEDEMKAKDRKKDRAEAEASAETEEKPQTKDPEEEALQTRFLRLSADFQNYKRRTEKEKSDIYAYGNERIVLQLLDVIDNFERAMDAAPAEGDQGKFAEGVGLILKQLTDILEKNNVAVIPAEGEVFDPNFHNAVMTEAVEDVESGKITKVFQKGYTLNKKVIRPSMVAVAE